MAVQNLVIKDTPDKREDRKVMFALPEIRAVRKIIAVISWVNLLIGLPSAILILSMHNLSLAFTGVLCILTFFLLQGVVRHISVTKSWTEFGVLAMCGVYLPSFTLWLCGTSLLGAILD